MKNTLESLLTYIEGAKRFSLMAKGQTRSNFDKELLYLYFINNYFEYIFRESMGGVEEGISINDTRFNN